MSKICAKCKTELSDSAFLCPVCGAIGDHTISDENADISSVISDDLPDGITPLIQYTERQAETTDVSGPSAEAAEKPQAQAAKRTIPSKSFIYACVAVIVAVAVLAFVSLKNSSRETKTYKSVIGDYCNALCSADGEKYVDTILPDVVIEYYESADQSRLKSLQDIAVNTSDRLTELFGANPRITFREIEKSELSEYEIQVLAVFPLIDGQPPDLNISSGYRVKLNVSIEGYEQKLVDREAEAIVMMVDGKWLLYSLDISDFPLNI